MRVVTTAPIAAVVLLFALWPARSQSVPDLNVDPVCRGIAQQASDPSETGGPDLSFAACVKNEQAMRGKLVGEWSTFSQSEKANCIGDQMGGMASYTDLVSCLEMAKDARQLNQVSNPGEVCSRVICRLRMPASSQTAFDSRRAPR